MKKIARCKQNGSASPQKPRRGKRNATSMPGARAKNRRALFLYSKFQIIFILFVVCCWGYYTTDLLSKGLLCFFPSNGLSAAAAILFPQIIYVSVLLSIGVVVVVVVGHYCCVASCE